MELLGRSRDDLKKIILNDPKNKTVKKKLKAYDKKILS